ncbi:MAG: hypothetical protein ACKOGA_24075 [Planctomycetaceae bacterium]
MNALRAWASRNAERRPSRTPLGGHDSPRVAAETGQAAAVAGAGRLAAPLAAMLTAVWTAMRTVARAISLTDGWSAPAGEGRGPARRVGSGLWRLLLLAWAWGLLGGLPAAVPGRLVGGWWGGGGASVAWGADWSVPEFNAMVKKLGPKDALPAERQRVRGRVMVLDRQLLRLRNCEVRFVGSPAGSLPERARHVEARGVLRRSPDDGKLEVVLESVEPVAGELEEFTARRKKLKNRPAKELHALADWGEELAKFYKDQVLAAAVQDLRDEALSVERKEVPEGRGTALLEFIERAAGRGVGPSLLEAWRHEACVWLVAEGDQGTTADREQILEQVRQQMPDCEDPQPGWDPELWAKYFPAKVEVYRNGSPAKRRIYRRMLYADAQLRWLQRQLLRDGSNHLEVASQIELLVPEEKAVATRLRNGVLDARAREIERLTKSELLEVTERYRLKGDEAKSRQLLATWLAWRRKNLGEVDVEGGMELAGDYRSLLRDNAQADQLLIELWQRVPGAEPLKQALEDRDWHLHEGQWLTAEAYRRRPESRWDGAILAARVEPGMPARYVVRALGPPTAVMRVATAGLYREQWVYGEQAGMRRIIRLERRRGGNELLVQGEISERLPATVQSPRAGFPTQPEQTSAADRVAPVGAAPAGVAPAGPMPAGPMPAGEPGAGAAAGPTGAP